MLFPGLLDIDVNGYQRWTSPSREKAEIVVLGASVGYGGYASSIERTYFHDCGQELERRGTPADIVVVATYAWKASQEVAALKLYAKNHRPQVIVLTA